MRHLKSTPIFIPNKLKSLYIPRKEHGAHSRLSMSNTQRQAFRELIMVIRNFQHRWEMKVPRSDLKLPNFIQSHLGLLQLPSMITPPNCEHRATLSFTKSSEAHTLTTSWNAELLRTSHHSRGRKKSTPYPSTCISKEQ